MPLLSRKTHVYMYLEPVDMRKSFDSLFGLVKNVLGRNIFDDSLFLFISRNRDKAKVLYFDGTGMVLFYKRLEKGTFANIRRRSRNEIRMTFSELQLFLEGAKIERDLPISPEQISTKDFS